jgi:uncharacterized membrane-anchored protein
MLFLNSYYFLAVEIPDSGLSEQEKHEQWAKEIRFGDREENTLNYNVRVLGRKCVLVLDFIAGMS